MTTILDPTNEKTPIARQLTPRSGSVTGNVAFLDISKPRGDVLLDRLEEQMKARAPGVVIRRYAKPTFTKPAPEALRAEIRASNHFVVEALAD
jgi:hypothetical protein